MYLDKNGTFTIHTRCVNQWAISAVFGNFIQTEDVSACQPGVSGRVLYKLTGDTSDFCLFIQSSLFVFPFSTIAYFNKSLMSLGFTLVQGGLISNALVIGRSNIVEIVAQYNWMAKLPTLLKVGWRVDPHYPQDLKQNAKLPFSFIIVGAIICCLNYNMKESSLCHFGEWNWNWQDYYWLGFLYIEGVLYAFLNMKCLIKFTGIVNVLVKRAVSFPFKD